MTHSWHRNPDSHPIKFLVVSYPLRSQALPHRPFPRPTGLGRIFLDEVLASGEDADDGHVTRALDPFTALQHRNLVRRS